MTISPAMVELASAAGPAALSMAAVIASGRIRSGRRRRELNSSLHELRRPLQALVLGGSQDHLERAIEALGELDRRVNGAAERFDPRPVSARDQVEHAAGRWRDHARRAGGDLRVAWAAGEVRLDADPSRLAAALDNLLANAIEHGRGPIDVLTAISPAGLLITVANDRAAGPAPRRRRDPRRGHGLGIAHRAAVAHRGALRCVVEGERHLAYLELPVIAERVPGARVART